MNSKSLPLPVCTVSTFSLLCSDSIIYHDHSVDWDDSQTNLSHLGGTAPGSAKSKGDKLWEDNWDDDDIEDDFSVQLRYSYSHLFLVAYLMRCGFRQELTKKGQGGVEPMQH